jgi:hypothetical protein
MPDLATADRLAIQELLAEYCHCIDRRRWDRFKDLFTPDCRLDLGPPMGLFDGAQGIARFCDTMASLPIVMRHLVTNVVLHPGRDEVRSEAYVLAITGPEGGPMSQMTGFYDDLVVSQGGRWRFRARTLTLDMPSS